jgi:hypothetical protein
VGLGDTNQPNMTVIPPPLFAAQPNLQLRIWFDDGVNGSVALNPLQNLSAAPYAETSTSASNLLGTLAAAQLSGAISSANLPASPTFSGTVTANLLSGNGAALTNIPVSSVGPVGTFGLLSVFLAPPIAYPVGSAPIGVAAADVNGDGKPDLISANVNDSTLTILTNNGSGGFVSNATLTVGSRPAFVIAGDVNGDGKLDLISADSSSNALTVWINNGSGGFSSSLTLPVGTGPDGVALVTNINGHGTLALVSANYNASTLTILTNNGSGVYSSNATLNLPAGSGTARIVAADVNGDNKVDLICANYVTGTLTVWTNNGSGVFTISLTIMVGNQPISLLAADLNGDGRMDLVCANFGSGTLTVLTNNGGGGFATATLNVGGAPYCIVAADMNNDGKPDLVVGDADFQTLAVYTNNGSGVFGSNSIVNIGSGPFFLVAADVNGDGKPDLITADNVDNTLKVVLNDTQAFSAPGAVSFANFANRFNGTFNGTFIGNGSGLSNLNASQITNGTLPVAQLPSAAVTNNATGVSLTGNFIGNGSSLSNLNASQITSGTLPSAQLGGTYNNTLSLLNNFNALTGNIKIGAQGTVLSYVQHGQSIMPFSSTVETNFSVAYPNAFTMDPKIIVGLANDPGFPNVNDTFAVSVSSNSPTGFRINVIRLDAQTGWSQALRVNWIAWQ